MEAKKTALVVIADGFEELEAIAPIDILRRGGVEVTLASAKGKDKSLEMVGANNIKIVADLYASVL